MIPPSDTGNHVSLAFFWNISDQTVSPLAPKAVSSLAPKPPLFGPTGPCTLCRLFSPSLCHAANLAALWSIMRSMLTTAQAV